MNTLVNFEIAQLLKEKGYNENCERLWHFNGSDRVQMPNRNSENFGFSAPTIAEVVMWLYEKHEIWIQGPFPYNNGKWEWVIFLLNEPLKDTDGYKNVMSLHHEPYKFSSPTEAYEAAIEYALNNLIK